MRVRRVAWKRKRIAHQQVMNAIADKDGGRPLPAR
jgi:hypothetical protein